MFDDEVKTISTVKPQSRSKPRLEISVTLTDGDTNPATNLSDEYEDEDRIEDSLSSPFIWQKSRPTSDTSDIYSSGYSYQVKIPEKQDQKPKDAIEEAPKKFGSELWIPEILIFTEILVCRSLRIYSL